MEATTSKKEVSLDESLEEFLRQRLVPEETIIFFKDQNIDTVAVQVMEEQTLQQWIPRYGDRLALRDFCKKQLAPKKLSLIEKLREKVMFKNFKTAEKYSPNDHVAKKQRTSRKSTRKIEIGWMCTNPDMHLIQVRKLQGGGTRHLDVDKNATGSDVLNHAKRFFFPNGKSAKGSLDDFLVELLDFKCNPIDLSFKVEDLFIETGLSRIRFYLSTTHIIKDDKSASRPISFDENKVDDKSASRPISFDENKVDDKSASRPISFDENKVDDKSASSPISFDENKDLGHVPYCNLQQFSYSDDELPCFSSHLESPTDNYSSLPNIQDEPIEKTESIDDVVILHRGNVFNELIQYIKIHKCNDFRNLKMEMVLPNGSTEMGEDLGGVLRDAITEFWETFYVKCTLGTNLKIPVLRHDIQKEEWTAIGKICSKGFLALGYFPVKIAPVFISCCFDNDIKDADVINNFLQYVCDSEAKLLKLALSDFNEVDYDELAEFCTLYDAKWMPREDNIKQLIEQIAMEELIQKPSFVKECFSVEFKSIASLIDVNILYKQLEPSSKNIIALFDTTGIHLEAENLKIYNYLKKFVKAADEKMRCAFLRFCTGSNLVTSNNIKIDFIGTEGFMRTPMAHTCSRLLQIPNTYNDFVHFREEFTNVLSANIWVMDIV